MQPTKTETSV